MQKNNENLIGEINEMEEGGGEGTSTDIMNN